MIREREREGVVGRGREEREREGMVREEVGGRGRERGLKVQGGESKEI